MGPAVLCVLLRSVRVGSRGRVEGEIIQVEATGSVATREGNMPLNVFNSTTVYLRNGRGGKKMRKERERERKRKDAILVLTLLCVEGNGGGGVL